MSEPTDEQKRTIKSPPKPRPESMGLDRPKLREKINTIVVTIGNYALEPNPDFGLMQDIFGSQLEALIPDIGKVYKEGYEDALKNLDNPDILTIAREALEEAEKQEREKIANEMGEILERKNSDYHSKCCGMLALWQALKEEK